MSRSRNIQSMIGYGLPYVFVERIKLTNSSSQSDNNNHFLDNRPSYIKNKFGKNEKQQKSELNNREFFTDTVYESHLSLLVPELLLSNRWFGKNGAEDVIVRVLQSTHPLATEALMNRRRYVQEEFADNLRPFIKEQIMSIPTSINLADYKTKEVQELEDILCLIPLETSFKVNSNHLTYFVYCQVGDAVGFKTVEKVIENGQTKPDATCYYLPNGQVWSGPVHFHEGRGWMAGPVHTSRPHPTLERMVHNNVKIQDYRVFRELEQLQNNINLSRERRPVRTFSDLFLSRDTEGGARGLFVFDMPRALVSHSKFNALFLVNNKNNLAKQSRIQEIKIVRQKIEQKNVNDFDYVDQADLYNLVARSEDKLAGSPLARGDYFLDENMDGIVEKYIGSVSEKSLVGLEDRRAFSFNDSEIKNFESGVYRYGVEITLTDPTDDHLQLQVNKLKKAHNILNEYYAVASNKQYYNPRGQLDYRAVKLLGKLYGSADMLETRNSFIRFPWRRAVKLYLTALRELTSVDTSLYARKLYAIMGPTSRTTEGVELFLKHLESLIQKLLSYDIKLPTSHSSARSAASHNRSPNSGLISIVHFFDKTYNTDVVGGHGLDYFGDYISYNSTGPLAVTPSHLHERFSIEADRRQIGVPDAQNAQKYSDLYSSLSPMVVKTTIKDYLLSDEGAAREARLRLLQSRREANSRGAGVPDQNNSPYEILRSLLRQNGNAATAQILKINKEDPCDPEVVRINPGQRPESGDIATILPGGKDDNFNSKEQAKPSGQDRPSDDLEQKVPMDILEALVGQDDHSDDLLQENVSVKYVTGFDRDLEIQYVDGPFASDLPYIIIMSADKDESQEDVLNEILIVGQVDNKEPELQEPQPQQEETTGVEEPEKEKEIEEGGEDPSIDLPDNAEAIPETTFSIGAEQLSTSTSSQAIVRTPVADAPPTVARTEQEQTYLVGTTTRGGMTPRGGTGGY